MSHSGALSRLTISTGGPLGTRATLDRAIRPNAAAVARFIPGRTAVKRERTAIVLLASMAGTVMLARATADETIRPDILDTARTFYLKSFSRTS
jgi:hypothetical protein